MKFEYKASKRGDPCNLMNYYLKIMFMGVILVAWHQKESWTAANVIFL